MGNFRIPGANGNCLQAPPNVQLREPMTSSNNNRLRGALAPWIVSLPSTVRIKFSDGPCPEGFFEAPDDIATFLNREIGAVSPSRGSHASGEQPSPQGATAHAGSGGGGQLTNTQAPSSTGHPPSSTSTSRVAGHGRGGSRVSGPTRPPRERHVYMMIVYGLPTGSLQSQHPLAGGMDSTTGEVDLSSGVQGQYQDHEDMFSGNEFVLSVTGLYALFYSNSALGMMGVNPLFNSSLTPRSFQVTATYNRFWGNGLNQGYLTASIAGGGTLAAFDPSMDSGGPGSHPFMGQGSTSIAVGYNRTVRQRGSDAILAVQFLGAAGAALAGGGGRPTVGQANAGGVINLIWNPFPNALQLSASASAGGIWASDGSVSGYASISGSVIFYLDDLLHPHASGSGGASGH
jgi:hypothetical protein